MSNFINGLFTGSLQPSTTVGGAIAIYENVWPDPDKTIQDVERITRDYESGISWRKAETIGDGAKQNLRTNQLLDITDNALLSGNGVIQNVHNQFKMLLDASVFPYKDHFKIDAHLEHEGYAMLKYSDSQYYGAHYDGGPEVPRLLSAICYLNDDYAGGELEFVNFKLKIKPQAGMLLIFPSNFVYAHIAHPVTSGIKYALVTWIRDY